MSKGMVNYSVVYTTYKFCNMDQQLLSIAKSFMI